MEQVLGGCPSPLQSQESDLGGMFVVRKLQCVGGRASVEEDSTKMLL